ncbi:MAG: hypothetical protein ACR2LN_07360 [Candidatus Levyibacteriota bacterium]
MNQALYLVYSEKEQPVKRRFVPALYFLSIADVKDMRLAYQSSPN